MKFRNAHSGPFIVAGGLEVAPGDVWTNAPESFREHALVKAGVFVEVVDKQPPATARSVRGVK